MWEGEAPAEPGKWLGRSLALPKQDTTKLPVQEERL
jgi:hypothetical protein